MRSNGKSRSMLVAPNGRPARGSRCQNTIMPSWESHPLPRSMKSRLHIGGGRGNSIRTTTVAACGRFSTFRRPIPYLEIPSCAGHTTGGSQRGKEPLQRWAIRRQSRPDALVVEQRPADLEDISLVRSFETFAPSFDEIFDWLWSNFRSLAQPKAEGVRTLSIDVPITPEQALRGGHARIFVPARASCPTCRGYGVFGPYECPRCVGEGIIAGEYPVFVAFPSNLPGDHAVLIPLDRFGIRNMVLSVNFRITAE